MSDSTPSTSSPTLRTGRRSDTGRLIFGLLSFAGRELAATLLVLIGASLLLFIVLKAAPVDTSRGLRLQSEPAAISVDAVKVEDSEHFAAKEYFLWLGGVMTGQFGHSSALQRGRPAEELIWPSAWRSFSLLFAGLGISVALALGGAAGRVLCPNSLFCRSLGWIIGLLSSIPVFLYVYIFVAGGNRAIAWGVDGGWWQMPHWFPLPVEAAFLPWLFAALILAVGDGELSDLFGRFQSELRHSSTGEHITGVRIMGLSVPKVIARGFIPGAASHVARRVSFFLGSLVVVEAALGWPGLGYLAWRAAAERDMPVLLGAALVMAAVLRIFSMFCDFVGYLADPRQRSNG